MTNNNDPLSEELQPAKEKIIDEITDNKVHNHLTDKNDLISEQDIKNIRTDLAETQTQGLSEEELKKAEEEKENKNDDDNEDHPYISSYNILGS